MRAAILCVVFLLFSSLNLFAKKINPWEKSIEDWSYEDCDALWGKDSPWKSQCVMSVKSGFILVNAFWQTRLSVLGKVKKDQIDKRLNEEEVKELSSVRLAESGLCDSLVIIWVAPLIKSYSGYNLTRSFWDDLQNRLFLKLENGSFLRPAYFLAVGNKQARVVFLKNEVITAPLGKVQLIINLEGKEIICDFDCRRMRYLAENLFN